MKYAMTSRLVLATVAALLAADAAARPASVQAMPEEHHVGQISYVTGGVGHDEALAMQRAAKRYPLELVFVHKAGKRDEYLANAPVTIRGDHDKVVFDGRSTGPYFLARLPEGSYDIMTHWEYLPLKRHVTVGKQTQRVVFEWKEEPLKALP